MNVAYLVSSPYSGSTLLSFLLNAHPGIGTISEYDVMDEIAANQDFLCSCDEPIRICSFFTKLKSKMEESGLEFEVDDMDMMFNYHESERINRYLSQKLPLIHSDSLERIRDQILQLLPYFRNTKKRIFKRNDTFMRSILELQNAKVFLDANKNPYRMKTLNERHDVKAIYLYKNGIGGAFSIYNDNLRKGRSCTMKEASRRWFIEQLTINRCLKHLKPENIHTLSYSDFCRDTAGELNAIHQFLGLNPMGVDGFSEAEHHIIGNKMRTGDISTITERSQWKEELSEVQKNEYRSELHNYQSKLEELNPAMIEDLWR